MNQANFKLLTDIIRTEVEGEPRPQVLNITPDGETLERIAMLLRRGVTRGIHPQWTFRKELNVEHSRDSLCAIANVIEDGFTSGEVPFGWRVDVYDTPSSPGPAAEESE